MTPSPLRARDAVPSKSAGKRPALAGLARRLHPARNPWWVIAVALTAVVGCAVCFYGSIDRLVSEARGVARSLEARQAVAEIKATLLDAETGQRGFIITGQERYLDPYEDAKRRVADRLLDLHFRLGDSAEAAQAVRRMARLSGKEMAELERVIATRRAAGAQAAAVSMSSGPGRAIMHEFRTISDTLVKRIDRAIEAGRAAFLRARRDLVVSTAGIALTALMLLLAVGRMRRRELRQSREREQESIKRAALMREQAIRDALTGVHNRRFLSEIGPELVQRSRAEGRPVTVAMIDLDHFKRLNDTHGHRVGDRVLSAVGAVLRDTLRPGELAFRYGGEEFALILPGSACAEAALRMEALRMRLSAVCPDGPGDFLPRITASFGIASLTAGVTDLEALLGAADRALFVSKHAGRDRVTLASAA